MLSGQKSVFTQS